MAHTHYRITANGSPLGMVSQANGYLNSFPTRELAQAAIANERSTDYMGRAQTFDVEAVEVDFCVANDRNKCPHAEPYSAIYPTVKCSGGCGQLRNLRRGQTFTCKNCERAAVRAKLASGTSKRTVFPSDELPHLWAHQAVKQASNGSNGNLSFDGPNFRSYRAVIGGIATGKKKQRIYLLSADRYSVTTAKHISMLRYAMPRDAVKFAVADPEIHRDGLPNHINNIDAWKREIASTLKDAARSREPKKSRLLKEATETAATMRAYVDAFGVKHAELPKLPKDVPELMARYAKEIEREKKEAAQRRKEREAADMLGAKRWMGEHPEYASRWNGTLVHANALGDEFQIAERERERIERERERIEQLTAWMKDHADIAASWNGTYSHGAGLRDDYNNRERAKVAAENRQRWLNGENVQAPYSGETELRVVGDTVETSRGARFPRQHARIGLALVRRVVASGTEWRTNGHTCHLGHYQIDKITADGTVYAGCHTVKLAAIERIAAELEREQ